MLGGLASCLLLADDLLQLRETLSRRMDIPEALIYSVYAVVVLVMLALCRRAILHGPYGWIVCALALMGSSVVIDVIGIPDVVMNSPLHFIVEDGAKAFGIGSWFLFFAFALQSSLRNMEPLPSEAHKAHDAVEDR